MSGIFAGPNAIGAMVPAVMPWSSKTSPSSTWGRRIDAGPIGPTQTMVPVTTSWSPAGELGFTPWLLMLGAATAVGLGVYWYMQASKGRA